MTWLRVQAGLYYLPVSTEQGSTYSLGVYRAGRRIADGWLWKAMTVLAGQTVEVARSTEPKKLADAQRHAVAWWDDNKETLL